MPKGTVWNYQYEYYDENSNEPLIGNLRLVFNFKTLKAYYNFFGSDLMGDFQKSALNAGKKFKAIPKTLMEKISDTEKFSFEDLSEDELDLLQNGLITDNSKFIVQATIAMVAAGENRLCSAEEIEEDLPITIRSDEYSQKLIEFISFCDENAKKNKIFPVWRAV